MRRLILAGMMSLLLLAGTGPLVPSAWAQSAATVTGKIMRDELKSHGRWYTHPRYGEIWVPGRVPQDWRPYTHGRWEWTKQHGWLWVSYFDWGWLTFHYGRWGHDPRYGWFWVPGTEWGPAWVAWRTGNGVVGWYPLPPEAKFDQGTGYFAGGHDYNAEQYTPFWVFVEERHFAAPTLLPFVIKRHRNFAFYYRTKRGRGYVRYKRRFFNRGVDPRRITRATGRAVAPARVRVARRRADWRRPRPNMRGGAQIYRPRVTGRPRPRGARARVHRGFRNDRAGGIARPGRRAWRGGRGTRIHRGAHPRAVAPRYGPGRHYRGRRHGARRYGPGAGGIPRSAWRSNPRIRPYGGRGGWRSNRGAARVQWHRGGPRHGGYRHGGFRRGGGWGRGGGRGFRGGGRR